VEAHSDNFVIPTCTVLIQSQSVADGQTTQTESSTIAKMRLVLRAVARENGYRCYCLFARLSHRRSVCLSVRPSVCYTFEPYQNGAS